MYIEPASVGIGLRINAFLYCPSCRLEFDAWLNNGRLYTAVHALHGFGVRRATFSLTSRHIYGLLQVCEVEALKRVHTWLPGEAVVTVPEVLLFDEKSHVIIMEDAGVDSVDLKTFMKTCGPSRALTAHIGDAVGAFLGALHTWGRNKDICTAMEGNKQARPLTARAYYGRLVPTLTGEDAPEKLKDPPLVVAAADLDVVRRVAAETTRAWLAVDDTVFRRRISHFCSCEADIGVVHHGRLLAWQPDGAIGRTRKSGAHICGRLGTCQGRLARL